MYVYSGETFYHHHNLGHAELDTKVNHYREDKINIYSCGEIHGHAQYSWFLLSVYRNP